MTERHPMDALRTEILWNRLLNLANEAASVLMRTAFSGVIRDVRDLACCLFDQDARLLAQDSLGTPGLAGAMPGAMRRFLSIFPKERLAKGDVLITNDPWAVSGHLNDTTLVSPIFAGDEIVGYAMSLAHQTDIGGRGMTLESRDVFEEGIWIPFLKLYDAGQPNETLFEFLRHNVRVPDQTIGDLRAQLAANDLLGREFLKFVEELGTEGVKELGDEIITRTERSARQAIGALRPGSYEAEMYVDRFQTRHGGFTEPLRMKVNVLVEAGQITVDFEGTSKQVDVAINCTLNGETTSYTIFGIKALIDPALPINDGFLKLIRIKAPEGSLVNPRFPAPVRARNQISHFTTELILAALAEAAPDKVIAASGTIPSWNQVFSGIHADGRSFSQYVPLRGGLGGSARADGAPCMAFPHNVRNLPVEALEADVPVVVERKEMLVDSEGAGLHRGGPGQAVRFRILEGGWVEKGSLYLGITGGRFDYTVPGMFGGGEAPVARIRFNGEPVRSGHIVKLQPGDCLEYEVPGGGGYGDAMARDPAAVLEDVRDDIVSVEAAQSVYGVVVGPGGGVDGEATEALRKGAGRVE